MPWKTWLPVLIAKRVSDPEKLLAATERMGLEGIVSKRPDQHYRSGKAQRKRRGSPISWMIRLPRKRCWTSRACKRN